jgi:hypothetical protein
MRCCQNKTNFSWSYQDSSKRSLENNVISRRGREKYTHFEIGGHVQMAKGDPEAQRKSCLSDCTWLKRWVWILTFETFEIPNALYRTGEFTLFYFITYILIFFFSHIYIFFLYTLFSFSLYSFFSFSFPFYFLICSPWTLNCIVPTSSPMLRRLLVLGQRW